MAGPELLDRDVLARLPAENEAQWYARVERELSASLAGPLALWADWKHPLVRAEMRRRRRQRWLGMGLLVGLPCAALAAALLIGSRSGASWTIAGAIAVTLAAVWPFAVILGSAAMAAESVVDERRRDTAAQLALTPLPPRTLAAAKVLPYLRTALWGLAALLPVYAIAAYSLPNLLSQNWTNLPSELAMMPLRPAIAIVMRETLAFTGPHATSFWPIALAFAVLMFVGDAIMAWAAVHWGAAWAVRHGGTMLAGGIAVARVLGVLLGAGLVLWAGEALNRVVWGDGLLNMAASAALLFGVMIFGGRWLARRATRAALREFAGFHRLAADRDVGERWPIGR